MTHHDPDDPLAAISLRTVAEPAARPGWVSVVMHAASLNMHDLWTLRGVGQDAADLPLILGCDGAGLTEDGREVIVLPVIADPDAGGGDETLDPRRALLSERHDGTFAERVLVPQRCVIDKPRHLSMAEAACVPVAWGTAFRMLRRAGVRAGMTVLVQGASGGVNSAAISLAVAMGARVWATARTQAARELALSLGAQAAFASGERVPERVDVVVDNVGAATFGHSLRCLKPGGAVVTCGATTGSTDAELHRVFFLQLSIIGSTGCTRTELIELVRLMEAAELRPLIDREITLGQLPEAISAMAEGRLLGKAVITDWSLDTP
ncbi:MAG: zinc-binding dehydrogenase [Bowdeniella nasicola]|nr:zinc-binding dehydrogenase [Bowdeniella nasicola]